MKHYLKSIRSLISIRFHFNLRAGHLLSGDGDRPGIIGEGRERERKDFIKINKLDFFLPDREREMEASE